MGLERTIEVEKNKENHGFVGRRKKHVRQTAQPKRTRVIPSRRNKIRGTSSREARINGTRSKRRIFLRDCKKVFDEGTDVVASFQEEANKLVDDALQTNQTYVTKEEVDTILATHFDKITQVLAHYTETVSSEQPLTETKAEEVSKGLIDTLKAILDDCRTQLRNYFQGKKQGVTHSLDTVRVTIKNSINGRVLVVNEQLKKFAAIMDKKFALEEKPSKKKAEESEKTTKGTQQESPKK